MKPNHWWHLNTKGTQSIFVYETKNQKFTVIFCMLTNSLKKFVYKNNSLFFFLQNHIINEILIIRTHKSLIYNIWKLYGKEHKSIHLCKIIFDNDICIKTDITNIRMHEPKGIDEHMSSP